MASEVKYAPKAVIDELDAWTGSATTVGDLLTDIEKMRNGFTGLTREFIVGKDSDLRESIEFIPYELAVIEHKFGTERLQPERETRYYVEFYDGSGDRTVVFNDEHLPVRVAAMVSRYNPKYEDGLDHETAVKAQALYGGTIEEIK